MCRPADAFTALKVYGHWRDKVLDAIDACRAAEREHYVAQAERRKERTAQHDGLRPVPDAG